MALASLIERAPTPTRLILSASFAITLVVSEIKASLSHHSEAHRKFASSIALGTAKATPPNQADA